jgi:hypothetical protein
VAAVTAAGDLLAELDSDTRLDREEFFARVRRATRLSIEPDVLEALAGVVLAVSDDAAPAEAAPDDAARDVAARDETARDDAAPAEAAPDGRP